MFDCSSRVQYVDGQRERFKRLEESSPHNSVASDGGRWSQKWYHCPGFKNPFEYMKMGFRAGRSGLRWLGLSLSFGASRTSKVDNLRISKKIFDPQDKLLLRMNRLFVMSCILAVAVDPLFLFLPVIDDQQICIGIDWNLSIVSSVLRTLLDVFFLSHIILQFRTAYISHSSQGFGSGNLVTDPKLIARRYLKSYFLVDMLAVLPLPQIIVWNFLHDPEGMDVLTTKNALCWIILFQYIPRLFRIFPLISDLKKTAGVFIETAWAGAAYYLLWFMLAGHNVGTFWYLLSIERENDCWDMACSNYTGCTRSYLYCSKGSVSGRDAWLNASTQVLLNDCSTFDINFGIYAPALTTRIVASRNFISKVIYCFWWGLQSMSTLGQGLQTSTYPGEVLFSIFICVLGLILFAALISKVQTYLQSVSIRLEEMRVKKQDTEQWMHQRMLPPELKERVRRYEQYKWLQARGVDEASLVQTLPKDLRRDIKRHLCLGLVKRVPLFENMDERLLDAICERLKPSLYTKNTYILREGDPVDEMLFIIRGHLESVTTDGGRSGFFNRGLLKEGDFCGEELLTWALDPKPSTNFPASTRTVRTLNEVEAFALVADELKFVASQFRRLHSRQVQHTFRFYSHTWRTWAASFIQVAWRRYCRRKITELHRKEGGGSQKDAESSHPTFGAAIYASQFAANALHRLRKRGTSEHYRIQKPPEPEFSVEDSDL